MAVFSGSGHMPLSLQNTSSSLSSEAALLSPTQPTGTFPRLHGARAEAGPCEQPDACWGPFYMQISPKVTRPLNPRVWVTTTDLKASGQRRTHEGQPLPHPSPSDLLLCFQSSRHKRGPSKPPSGTQKGVEDHAAGKGGERHGSSSAGSRRVPWRSAPGPWSRGPSCTAALCLRFLSCKTGTSASCAMCHPRAVQTSPACAAVPWANTMLLSA